MQKEHYIKLASENGNAFQVSGDAPVTASGTLRRILYLPDTREQGVRRAGWGLWLEVLVKAAPVGRLVVVFQ